MVAVHVTVRDMAEINPAMRVLMPEQRRKRHISLTIIRGPEISAGPAIPRRCGQRIGRGAQTKTIEKHPFVISDPIVWDETRGWEPAHGYNVGPLSHPIPIHPVEDRIRDRPNAGFVGVGAVEILFGMQYSGQ